MRNLLCTPAYRALTSSPVWVEGEGFRIQLTSLERSSGAVLAVRDSMAQGFVLQVLSWIDICAGLAAKTVARGPVVTASVDTVHFLRPCHQGSVAIIAAMVNRVFHSSMEASVAQHAAFKGFPSCFSSLFRVTCGM